MTTVKTTNKSNLNLGNTRSDNEGVPSNSKTLYFVEPLDGSPVDNKDLFIYVNLTASRKARSILQLTNESGPKIRSVITSDTEINLIGYREDKDGNRVMTTDWTTKPDLNKILGKETNLDPNNTTNVFEGFGVTDIDINITAMNPPTVTIKFIDTRGGGLFDQETFNENVAPINAFQNNSSPYSIFFELPPPLFYLTIKGFYGNPVTLCLYLVEWKGNFNSETGNFEITANFLGYTFAFLNDVKIGHLIGAGNTDKGRQKLLEVSSLPSEEGYIFPVITIDELSLKLQRITVKREEEQKNSIEFKRLKVINEQISYLKNFKNYLGSPASPNLLNNIYGSSLDPSSLSVGTEQLFFRDIGIISKNAETNYNNLGKIISNGLKKYEEFKNGNQSDFYNQGDLTLKDIQFKFKLDEIKDTRNNIEDTLVLVNDWLIINGPSNIPTVTVSDFSGKTQGKWLPNSVFYIINLKKSRESIDLKLKNLLEEKKRQETIIENKVNKEISDILGFTPNIRTIIGILCNNIEMFLSLMYDIGKRAENKKELRFKNLDGYFADTPSGQNYVYPFPKIVDKNYNELYLGEINTLDQSLFPEISFIDELCTGLVYSIKQITQYNTSVNNSQTISKSESFPINSGDVGLNPYLGLDGLPSTKSGTLNKEIIGTILKRPFIAYSVSNYKTDNFNKIAELESINFYETFVSQTYKDMFNQVSTDQTNQNSLLQLGLTYNLIKDKGTDYEFYIPLDYIFFELDTVGKTNSGNRIWDKDLNLREKINSSLKPSDLSKFKSNKNSTQYIQRYFDESKNYLNKSYFTLATFKDDTVKNSIKNLGTLDSANLLETYTLEKFLTLPQDGLYQNTYFYVPPSINTLLPLPITKSSIYSDTTNEYGKAYLLLSSFIFSNDKEFHDEIIDDYSKIIRVPWYYLLWLGANSYRYNNDEILSFNSEFPVAPKDEFYHVTKKVTDGKNFGKVPFLMEKYFKDWVNSQEYIAVKETLESLLNTENLSDSDRKKLIDKLNQYVLNEYDLLVENPNKIIYGNTDVIIPKTALESYLSTFMVNYKKTYTPNTNMVQEDETKLSQNVVNDNDIKRSFYIDLKQIYDNWIAGNSSEIVYSCCKTVKARSDGKRLKLFDLFKFVDKFRNTIAGDAIANINSFNSLVFDKTVGMYNFISKILTDSYFMHFNLPIYIEYNKPDEVQSIFEPQVNFKNIKNSPNFLCVYNGPPSSSLSSGNNYTDDSFKFNVPGSLPLSVYDRKENEKNSYLVAFNVNYGSQFQPIFKNVNVGMQESKITGEYITLLCNYIGNTGASKPLLKDNSIYPLQRNRSYTATIQMLGDMMIQPQMYFQLNNIPFFSGSYMIMSISHSIKPNNMYTTFKGVRQNRSPVKIVTEATSFLNFQFDQTVSSDITFTNGIQLTPVQQQQLSNTTPILGSNINYNYSPITGNLIIKPFNKHSELHLGIDIEVDSISTLIKSTNKSGSVFYNLEGNDTTNGKLIIKHDIDNDGYIYFTGYFWIKNNNYMEGTTINANQNIGSPTLFSSPPYQNKYFYHYEVRRTKEQISSYNDYLNSNKIETLDPQQFSTLEMSIINVSLHTN